MVFSCQRISLRKESDTGKKNKKRSGAVWYIVLVAIGILVFLIIPFMWKDYLSADVRFRAEAELVSVESSKHYREKSTKQDDNDPFESNFEEYYAYKLNWRFYDPVRQENRTYYTETESSFDGSYQEGEKETIYVYYTGDGDFEINTLGETLVVIVIGSGFILAAFVLMILDWRKKRRLDRMIAEAQK